MLGFVALCLSFVFLFAGCSVFADPNDGRCDICGKKTSHVYAGKECCWDCYYDIQDNWNKSY